MLYIIGTKTVTLQVGKMSAESFQLLCTEAINSANNKDKRNGEYSAQLKEPYCMSFKKMHYEYSDKEIFEFNLSYDVDNVNIIIAATQYAVNRKSRNGISRYLDDLAEILVGIVKRKADDKYASFSEYSEIYPYGLNPITCFDREEECIKHICLTPYCSIQNEDELLRDSEYITNSHTLNFARKFAVAFDGILTIVLTKRYICNVITMNPLYLGGFNYPLCALISDTQIEINTPLYVKSECQPEDGFWLFISTDGIIYGENTLKAAMSIEFDGEEDDIDATAKAITYRDGSKTVRLPLNTSKLELSEEVNGEIKTFSLSIEKTVELSDGAEFADDIQFISLKQKVKRLGANKYFDGTVFKAQLTPSGKAEILAAERNEAFTEEYPVLSKIKEILLKILDFLKEFMKGIAEANSNR